MRRLISDRAAADIPAAVHSPAVAAGTGWRPVAGWRRRRVVAGNLVAARVHALRIGRIVALLQAHLRILGRTGTHRGSGHGPRSGADRGALAASDRRAKSGAEHRADHAGQHLLVVGLLRSAGGLLVGELLADRLVLLERIERFARSWHHRHGGPHRLLDTALKQQQRGEGGGGRGFQGRHAGSHVGGLAGITRHCSLQTAT